MSNRFKTKIAVTNITPEEIEKYMKTSGNEGADHSKQEWADNVVEVKIETKKGRTIERDTAREAKENAKKQQPDGNAD